MIRWVRHPKGIRCYVIGRRLHHGSAGAIALAACVPLSRTRLGRRKILTIALAGAISLWDDRGDFPFRDCDNH